MHDQSLPDGTTSEIALDAIVEAALNAYPLAPAPSGFSARVMAQLRPPKPIFHLEFIDLALPAFFALFSAGILAVTLYLLFGLDKLTRLQLELQIKVWLAQVSAPPVAIVWMPILVACGVIGTVALVGIGIWTMQRPPLRAEE
jgi:hypothetical protein